MSYLSIFISSFFVIISCNALSIPAYLLGKILKVNKSSNRFFSLLIGLMIFSLIIYFIQ